MKDAVIRPEFIAHAQDDSLAGTAMIGWLTRRRQSISRKWSDVSLVTNGQKWGSLRKAPGRA